MIYFNFKKFKLLLLTALITILSACGGGGGGGGDNSGGGFTNNTSNTKPQNSSAASLVESSKSAQANSSSSMSTSVKVASSVKATTSGPDITPPPAPDNFAVVSAFSDVIFLSWSKTTDNGGVVAYKLYRDGVQIADLADYENYYADYNVAPGKTYNYSITAGDIIGNWSEIMSIPATATIPPQTSSKSSSSSTASSLTNSAISVSSSGNSNISSSKASSTSNNTSSATSISKVSSSSSSVKIVVGVSFQWQRPTSRENGSDLFENEIARYELRYRLPGTTMQISLNVNAPLISQTLLDIPSNADFEIATVDTNGLYSQFVAIQPL